MNNTDLDPDPESIAPTDSFVSAIQGEAFFDQPLNPWSPPRKIAAQGMGMLYPYIGDDGFEAVERTGVYPGALRDVIIFIWLRLQKDSEVLRAQRKPLEAWRHAELWAESCGLLNLSGEKFKIGYKLFADKMGAVAEANGDPDLTPESEPSDPKA